MMPNNTSFGPLFEEGMAYRAHKYGVYLLSPPDSAGRVANTASKDRTYPKYTCSSLFALFLFLGHLARAER